MKSISLDIAHALDENFLKILKESGFSGIDLGLNNQIMATDAFKGTIETVRELFDLNRLICSQVHLPYYNIFDSSELYDDEKEAEIKNAFEAMAILGAKWGAYHPMSATNYEYDRKRAMNDNREKLKKYLETASKFNVGIAVENLTIFPDCCQYRFFTYDEDDHIELVDSLNSELIAICWDFGHSNLMKYDMAQVLDKLGDRIKITHVHDNTKMCDLHICPGIGKINWESVMPILKKHHYSGPVNLELELSYIHPEILREYLNMCSKMAGYLENFIN